MDHEPLVAEQIEKGLSFVKSIDPLLGVKAAYWLKVPQRVFWRLHIAADKVTDNKFEFIPDLLKTYLEGDYDGLDVYDITLDHENDRIARGVVEFKAKNVTDKPKRLGGQMMGGEYIEGAYIYAYPPSSN